jgi:hypothetical protein
MSINIRAIYLKNTDTERQSLRGAGVVNFPKTNEPWSGNRRSTVCGIRTI